MRRMMFVVLHAGLVSGCVADLDGDAEADAEAEATEFRAKPPKNTIKNNKEYPNPAGASATFSDAGKVDLGTDFTKDFGTNGRTCITCHTEKEGWTISPSFVQSRFASSNGLDPLFRPVDGANSPLADVSTLAARQQAYSLLLSRAVIRVGIGIPDNAEFELVAVDDPYNYASAAELSLFRRPLPAANLSFMASVMWDGRVTGATLLDALGEQANGATLGHAEALAPLTTAQREEIVDFEFGLSHAQIKGSVADKLSVAGGKGGPEFLSNLDRAVGPFTIYDAWSSLQVDPRECHSEQQITAARMAIARGQALFNTATSATGSTCRGCHNVANVGTNFNGTFFDVGVSSPDLRSPEVPLYTLRNLTTGEEISTTDPGRALITGRWNDMNRFKVPSLRGLAARAPFFHDGSSATLLDVVHHYETALGFDFTPAEEADLVAFMNAL